jgi:hypothetical protein
MGIEECMYRVVFGSKGRSLIARTNIYAGTIVLKELPFLVAEDVYDALYQLYRDDNDESSEQLYEREKFEELTPDCLDKFAISYEEILEDMNGLPSYIQDVLLNIPKDQMRLLVTKFSRNAFTFTSPPCALLSQGTLMNHSCDNNIDFYIDTAGRYVFTAKRDICEGEELCDTYMKTYKSTKKRKENLLYQYGFTCQCVKCANGT